jgi:hypothetical protein
VTCEVRGEVIITGLTDARIPWPIAKRPGERARSWVVYAGLADAVRTESATAICYWWGITPQTVTKWRKAMGVGPMTDGTARLRSQSAAESPLVAKAREAARATDNDPARVEKIRRSKLGKPRPAKVIQAMRDANLGRERTAETRAKMSAAKTGKPRAPRRDWTPEELALLGQLSDAEVAKRTGRSEASVWSMRRKVSIEPVGH